MLIDVILSVIAMSVILLIDVILTVIMMSVAHDTQINDTQHIELTSDTKYKVLRVSHFYYNDDCYNAD